MKLILQRSISIMQWRVIATIGYKEHRPEIAAILTLVGESSTGAITGKEVAGNLLGGRPTIVGDQLLRICAMMKLLEADEYSPGLWRLTELGKRSLSEEVVATPQRGEFDIWTIDDEVYPEIVLRVTEAKHDDSQSRSEVENIRASAELPPLLSRCVGRGIVLPWRVESDPREVLIMEIERHVRLILKLDVQLHVECDQKVGMVKLKDEKALMPDLLLNSNVPTLDKMMTALNSEDAIVPKRVKFTEIKDSERRHPLRTLDVKPFQYPGLGSFNSASLKDVPLIPETQADADSWAAFLLMEKISGYIWPDEYKKLTDVVLEKAVNFGWVHAPGLPSQLEFAQKQLVSNPVAAHRLLVPLELPNVIRKVNTVATFPILIVSGRAAQSSDRDRIISERGSGLPRVFVLVNPGEKNATDVAQSKITKDIGSRFVVRQVKQAPDAWVAVRDGKFEGQKWHPKTVPGPRHGALGNVQSGQETSGRWIDLERDEILQSFEELSRAFWQRGESELDRSGRWAPIRAR